MHSLDSRLQVATKTVTIRMVGEARWETFCECQASKATKTTWAIHGRGSKQVLGLVGQNEAVIYSIHHSM